MSKAKKWWIKTFSTILINLGTSWSQKYWKSGGKTSKIGVFCSKFDFFSYFKSGNKFLSAPIWGTNTKHLIHFMEARKILAFIQNMAKPGVKMAKYYIFSLKTQNVRPNWVLNGLRIGFLLSKLFFVQFLKAGRFLECSVIVLLVKIGGKISKSSRSFVKSSKLQV